MFKGHFKYETILNSDLDNVWDFFSSTENLVKITRFPKVKLESDPAVIKGQHIKLTLNFILFRLKWHLVIHDVQDKQLFIDEAITAPFPFKQWRHTHAFKGHEEHTVMTDQVEFEALLPSFLIRWMLTGMFKDRERTITRFLHK